MGVFANAFALLKHMLHINGNERSIEIYIMWKYFDVINTIGVRSSEIW